MKEFKTIHTKGNLDKLFSGIIFLGLILLVIFLSRLPLSKDYPKCQPPKVKVGDTCCVLSERFYGMMCVEEEDLFIEKLKGTYENSIITDGSILKNEKASFSFYPAVGYFLVKDIELLHYPNPFYLFNLVNETEESCEMKISYVLDYPELENDEAYNDSVNNAIEDIKNLSNSNLIDKRMIQTDSGVSGYSFTISYNSTTTKVVYFINKIEDILVTFAGRCSEINSCNFCIPEFDEMVSTFKWD